MKKRKILISILVAAVVICAVYLHNAYTVPVLMYHHIGNGADKSRLIVTPKSFERQMRFLSFLGYRFLTLDEYVTMLKENKKPRGRAVVITFDDGYEDNYLYAYPVLLKQSIPATIFVVVDWIGQKDMMDWKQVKELSAGSLIEIGSHSMSHCELTKIPKPQVISELRQSKEILESKLKKEVRYFCYPCGMFDFFIKEMVNFSGYRGACATHPGRFTALNDEFTIRRIRVSLSADNLFVFWAQVSGYYTFFRDRAP